MIRSWKFWAVLAVVVGLVAMFSYGLTVDPKLVKSPLLGKAAPGFTVTRLGSAEPLSLAALRGKPVILNFWASWCVACREEASILQQAHLEYERGRNLIHVVGIAIQDKPDAAMAFARQFGKTYFLALDSATGEISLNYGIYGVPETFFIDSAGIIRFKKVGAVTAEEIRDYVAQMTKSGPAATPEPSAKKEGS